MLLIPATQSIRNYLPSSRHKGKGKGGSAPEGAYAGYSSLFHRPLSPSVDKPLLSVTHGQCDARPTVTFPA